MASSNSSFCYFFSDNNWVSNLFIFMVQQTSQILGRHIFAGFARWDFWARVALYTKHADFCMSIHEYSPIACAHDGRFTNYCCSMHNRSYSEYKFSQVDEVEFASRWGGIGKGDGAAESEMIPMNICGSAMIRWNWGLNFGGTFLLISTLIPSLLFLRPGTLRRYCLFLWFRDDHIVRKAFQTCYCLGPLIAYVSHAVLLQGPALGLGSFGACSGLCYLEVTARCTCTSLHYCTLLHYVESSCI